MTLTKNYFLFATEILRKKVTLFNFAPIGIHK